MKRTELDKRQMKAMSSMQDMVNRMSENDLMLLNQIIVDRLNVIQRMNKLNVISQFSKGDTVSFSRHGIKHIGVVEKLNQKTISVTTSDGLRWNVTPELLIKELN
jgi:hypothetical protein